MAITRAAEAGWSVLRDDGDPDLETAVRGSGPALVVVPPAQGDWRFMAATFAPMAARRRVVVAGLRRRDGRASSRTLDDHVADLARALDAAEVARADVYGVSFGGQVALAFALAHPQRVRRLVLHATSAKLRDHEGVLRLARGVTWGWARGQLVHAFAAWQCWRELAALGPRRLARVAWRVGRLWVRHGTPAAVMARRIDLFCATDLEGRLPSVRSPTLVLTGGRDALVPARSSSALVQRLPGATASCLDGSGHLAVLTEPERVTGALEAFLGADGPG